MRREQFLVDSCYSNSDANDGRGRNNIDIHLQIAKTSSEHVFVSVCEKAAGACVRNAFQCLSRACVKHVLLTSGFAWLRSVASVFAACVYLRHAQH